MNETFRVSQVGGIEYDLTFLSHELGLTIVNHRGCEHADAGMTMVVVVPREKSLRMDAAVLARAEAVRKIRPVLHRAELTFRIGIVVRNVRTAVRFCDAQVGHQEGDRFGCHR